MIVLFFGIFLILHGIVFYLYAGHSVRLFELKPGMTWPEGSRVFSKILNDRTTRKIGFIFCLLSGTGFIAGGTIFFFGADWWQQIVMFFTILSSIVIILLWDGSLQKLSEQGFVGMLINLLILVLLLFRGFGYLSFF